MGLVSFIKSNLADLKDPYEGEPLTDDWENLIETKDAHQYGDFALTKYYAPSANMGLGTDWNEVQMLFADGPKRSISPILGETVGPLEDPFDPGKMGAYFQSAQMVQRNFSYLTKLGGKQLDRPLKQAIEMLEAVLDAGCGLYVTFRVGSRFAQQMNEGE